MKKYINIAIIILVSLFVLWSGYTYLSYTKLKKEYSISVSNEKAFLLESNELKNNIRALTLTVEELEVSKDSTLQELNEVRRRLKIKDKELKSLHNIKNEVVKTDTLLLKDTIFIKESFKLDSLLGDKWCSLDLHLEYPNIIGYKMSYNSDLDVIVYTEKETIEPPKKCWLLRIFQKKHNVTRVEVQDSNPYSNIKNQKFVIID